MWMDQHTKDVDGFVCKGDYFRTSIGFIYAPGGCTMAFMCALRLCNSKMPRLSANLKSVIGSEEYAYTRLRGVDKLHLGATSSTPMAMQAAGVKI